MNDILFCGISLDGKIDCPSGIGGADCSSGSIVLNLEIDQMLIKFVVHILKLTL